MLTFSPLLLDLFGRLLVVDRVLTNGSMSLFVHILNLKKKNKNHHIFSPDKFFKSEYFTFMFKKMTEYLDNLATRQLASVLTCPYVWTTVNVNSYIVLLM